ncbi:glutamine--tRNA ligase/YqeY domain fusion protein [Arachidicoccus ginsenosidivorans]|jgi:glutaminyl-tRNA synthetase|uniref:Glutamine--tRNA ligase n=1 Tax=Arachidicoccus ginsenosidivorans TaxID=496057 RepID=A0A5B8VNW1_9BACT|nr:glutamine--tRNA ligase/YqeY domain fusion protein [Arachidicoccus ginsenosidivorans]QEC72913.1 glutamine--tRNA ligase/YqeY domain fusion protein [Arachidicoccus ginsenosidivorans]
MSEEKSLNFIEEIIENDLKSGKYDQIVTRFPPEPNGYLHIGHAKSICLNFGLAEHYNGRTNLRFDDTNPEKEETEYVESIKADIKWLGFDWDQELYTSDYFEQLYQFALTLIKKGLAYVDDSTSEQIAAGKGTPTTPGVASSYRSRSIEENLQLFEQMRAGKFKDGEKVLRAKIDLAAPNMLLRDPLLYRIKHATHHRTGDQWCIYPMYDFAHGQSDSIEHITHSICTLEFVPHRPVYDWLIEKLEIFPSHQYEFARLNMTYTVMSKRKLLQLVSDKIVEGWDDPRMPTISGMRRRGYTPKSIREFSRQIGVAKRENLIDLSLLEFFVREDLNKTATRRMVVFDPVKLVITNFAEDQVEYLEGEDNPEAEQKTYRKIPFTKELYIEREDFMVDPPKKFFRLAPGKMVRLKYGYIIRCDQFKQDENGNITEIACTYFPESKSGSGDTTLKAKGTLHWVSATKNTPVTLKLYDRLFTVEDMNSAEGEYKDHLNPQSLVINNAALAEPAILEDAPGLSYQFLRKGYFIQDKEKEADGKPVFNRTVGLKDSWAKETKK